MSLGSCLALQDPLLLLKMLAMGLLAAADIMCRMHDDTAMMPCWVSCSFLPCRCHRD